MRIRRPRPDELDNIAIVMEYYADDEDIASDYDSDCMVASIREYLINPAHCWLCLYDGDRIVGFVSGYLCDIPWNKKFVANLQFLYCIPSHRTEKNLQALLKEFEDWAWNQKASSIFGHEFKQSDDSKHEFYQHQGYGFPTVSYEKVRWND